MNFSEALKEIMEGERLTRLLWNKKKFIYLVRNSFNNINHIEVRDLAKCIMYSANSEDLLANDWVKV